MQISNEELLGQLFYNKFKKNPKVISIEGTIICNTTAPNQRNKVIMIISTTSKSLSYYILNFFVSVEVLLKKTSRYFKGLCLKR